MSEAHTTVIYLYDKQEEKIHNVLACLTLKVTSANFGMRVEKCWLVLNNLKNIVEGQETRRIVTSGSAKKEWFRSTGIRITG